MARKPTHSLSYRIWNQTRLARHVDSYFQVYDEITRARAEGGNLPHPADDCIVLMSNALYQTMIVHLDMIKASQGVGLYALVGEAAAGGDIDATTEARLKSEIDKHSNVLRNIGRQRNNLVAHRSATQTFADIRAAFPVTSADLASIIDTYYRVAAELYTYAPFQNVWMRIDSRSGAKAVVDALRASQGQVEAPDP